MQQSLIVILKYYIHKGGYNFIAKNSQHIVSDLCKPEQIRAGRTMQQGHTLCTFDFDAMYTNISLDMFMKIIEMDFTAEIQMRFSIELSVLLTMLESATRLFNYIITHVDNQDLIFRQSKGVPMGWAPSYFISEIVTSKAAASMLNTLNLTSPRMSFIYKYVDDMFIATDEAGIMDLTVILAELLPGMNLRITRKNSVRKVVFLEFTAIAKGRSIKFKWYRKDYGSDQMIDFFSGHRLGM